MAALSYQKKLSAELNLVRRFGASKGCVCTFLPKIAAASYQPSKIVSDSRLWHQEA